VARHLGVYGFDRHQTTILAALVTEDPLLLVGRSGTGKTFLLNTLSEARALAEGVDAVLSCRYDGLRATDWSSAACHCCDAARA